MIENVYRSSCKETVILVRFQLNFYILNKFSKNPQKSKLMKILRIEAELFHADGRTDMTKVVVGAFAILRTHQKIHSLSGT